MAIVCSGVPAWPGDAVPFSGKVKKVIAKRNKVAIKDPVNKKRFTVVIDATSKLTGYSGIGDIKKGDSVSGKYVVTDKGLYVVTEMEKN
jgi:hypothetical protein